MSVLSVAMPRIMAEVAISTAKVDSDFSIESGKQAKNLTIIGETGQQRVIQLDCGVFGWNAVLRPSPRLTSTQS